MISDRRTLKYAVQGTSSPSTWRARIYPFLNVLTSTSIFFFAYHEPLTAEVLPSNLNNPNVADIGLAYLSDSSAILDLLSTHCNHYTAFYGPAPFLSQVLYYFASVDDNFDDFASSTLCTAVLQLDPTNCVGVYGIVPPASTARSLASSVILLQSQLSESLINLYLGNCIQAHRQKTFTVTPRNHASAFLRILLKMGLNQVLAIAPFSPRLGCSAPLTVITSATRITDSTQPDSVLIISINFLKLLFIHQINSDIFYQARLRSGLHLSEVIFDTLARNIAVSAFVDISATCFSVLSAPLAGIALRGAFVAEFLASYVWGTPNAKELWELLERDLGAHCNSRIAVPGCLKPCRRSINTHTYAIDKVLSINNLFQNEDYMEHQDVLLHRALEDVLHVITAWALMSLGCHTQIALRHHTRNHRSEIGTNIMLALLGTRTSDAICSRRSLVAAESANFSVRRLPIDHDEPFVDGVKTISRPNIRLTFGCVQFFNPHKAVEVFPSAVAGYSTKFFPSFIPLHAPTLINVPQHNLQTPQSVTRSFSLVEHYGMDIWGDNLSGLECIRRVWARNDAQPNTFHVLPIKSSSNHLKSASNSAPLPTPFLLRHDNLSCPFQDLDRHPINLTSRNTAMGTVHAFHSLSEIGRFDSAALKDSGAIPGTPLPHNGHQAPEDQIVGKNVSGGSVRCSKNFENLHRAIVWMRNPRHIALTKSAPSHSSRLRIHDGHLAISARAQQFLSSIRGSSAFQIYKLIQISSATESFLDHFSFPLKPTIQVPDPTPSASDVNESAVLLGDISPLDRRQMSRERLKPHLSVSSTFSDTSSGLSLEDNASSAVGSSHLETLTLAVRLTNAEFETSLDFLQNPTEENVCTATFKTPVSQLSNSIQGHCVGGIPLCPASVYLEQVFVSLKLSTQHLHPINGKYAVLRAIDFIRPLVYNDRDPRAVIIEFSPQQGGQGTFFVASEVDGNSKKTIHVRGDYRIDLISRISTKFRRTLPIINRRISSVFEVKNGKIPQRFSTRTIYEVILSRVIDYSKEYQTIQSLTVEPTGVEGYASIKLPALSEHRSRFTIHQIFIDTLLHVAGFVVILQVGVNDAYICSRIDAVNVIPTEIEDESAYGVYCSQCWLADQGIAFAEAYAVKLADPPILVARLKGIHFRKVRLGSLKRSVHGVRDPTSQEGTRLIRSKAQPLTAHPSFASAGVPPSAANPWGARPTSTWPASNSRGGLHCPVKEGPRTLMPPTTDQGANVRRILAAALVEDIGEDDNLEKLGLCTSTSQGMITAFKTKFGIEVPEQNFNDRPTLKAIQSYPTSGRSVERSQSEAHILPPQSTVSYLAAGDSSKPTVSVSSTTAARLTKALKLGDIPILLQESTTSSLPLFLIHDGSGLITYYRGIPSLGRRVWGINNPNFISSERWRSVVEMASCYACHIAKVTTGPIILGGWSFGGVVAYEACLQLIKKRVKVRGILLIDSPNPINHVPLSEYLIDSIINLDARGANTDLGRLVKAQFSLNADMLSRYDPREMKAACPPIVLLRSSEGFHPPDISNIPPWLADRSDPKTATRGWESLLGGPIKVLDIPGHHFAPFKPANIKRVCERMKEACALFEAG